MEMVSRPIENWASMRGERVILKKLNAFLSEQFIGGLEVPARECGIEARALVELKSSGFTSDPDVVTVMITSEQFVREVAIYLKKRFGDEQIRTSAYEVIAVEVAQIFDGRWPPQLHDDPLMTVTT